MSTTVKFNLRGKVFTVEKTLFREDKTKNNTKMAELLSGDQEEVLLNRNPKLFNYLLDYYRDGTMHYPGYVCSQMLRDELQFWGLSDDVLAPCCWHRYKSELDKREIMAFVSESLNDENKITNIEAKASHCNRLHLFLNYPKSSKMAKVWSKGMLCLICISILLFMLDSIPSLRVFFLDKYHSEYQNRTEGRLHFMLLHSRPTTVLIICDVTVTSILTVDFILKFISSPHKGRFWLNIPNIIDFCGIFPILFLTVLMVFRVTFEIEDWEVMKQIIFFANIFRVLRVFRLFHLMKHYKTLLLIHMALKMSAKELLLLIIMMFVWALKFANLIYFAEVSYDNFWSVPEGLWWAFITMTTVGYGDVYPLGVYGRIIGCICAMMGILVIALPVPVIVSNFSMIYDAAKMLEREDKYRNRSLSGNKYSTITSSYDRKNQGDDIEGDDQCHEDYTENKTKSNKVQHRKMSENTKNKISPLKTNLKLTENHIQVK